MGLTVPEARRLFPGAAGYLNTTTVGLAPDTVVAALHADIERWRQGTLAVPEYDALIDGCRAAVGRLTGVAPDTVAVAGQVSTLVGVVAASLPEGAEVVTYERDFTSILFPFLARRDLVVHQVPLAAVADAVNERTALVALSTAQSADGALADLDALRQATARYGTAVLLDGTQSVGWHPTEAEWVDYHVVGAYKWLLCPRGTAFMSVRPSRWDDLPTPYAGWYAGDDVWNAIYGGPLRLAATARRFDLSPAWLAWVGTAPALELLEQVGVDAIFAHDVGLANEVRAALQTAPASSPVLSLEVDDATVTRLAAAGVRYAMRDGRARFSFHLYNDGNDVDRLVDALGVRSRRT